MRFWILVSLAGLAASGCFLHHKDSANYTAVPGLVAEPANGPTITIVSNTPPPPVQDAKPVPTVVTNNVPAPTTPLVAAAPVENHPPVKTPPHPTAPETNASANPSHPIVTPAEGLTGKVASVNAAGKFVVLSFPLGQMPAFDQALNLYRKGVKVAEVKVTGPKLDENIVADLAQGSAEVGDDVREH
jgi:hypothetical protein